MAIANINPETALKLKTIVENIEKYGEEKKKINGYVNDAFSQAISDGFNKKVIKRLLANRKKNPDELSEEDQLLEIYEAAVGTQQRFDI